MRFATFSFIATIMLTAPVLAGTEQISPELRAQATQFCTGDAMRFCLASIMDETQTTACMRANRAQLSPSCRVIVDKGLRATRR